MSKVYNMAKKQHKGKVALFTLAVTMSGLRLLYRNLREKKIITMVTRPVSKCFLFTFIVVKAMVLLQDTATIGTFEFQ